MGLPYQIATLLYCFDQDDRILLMERVRPPNQGLWSPPGGKLHMADGESPYACACREAGEELGLALTPSDLHLTALISEHGYEGHSHWLMFLFEVKRPLGELPPPMGEGRFEFFSRSALQDIALPETDREQIWPLFWKHRGGFFSAHCKCSPESGNSWTLEEVFPP